MPANIQVVEIPPFSGLDVEHLSGLLDTATRSLVQNLRRVLAVDRAFNKTRDAAVCEETINSLTEYPERSPFFDPDGQLDPLAVSALTRGIYLLMLALNGDTRFIGPKFRAFMQGRCMQALDSWLDRSDPKNANNPHVDATQSLWERHASTGQAVQPTDEERTLLLPILRQMMQYALMNEDAVALYVVAQAYAFWVLERWFSIDGSFRVVTAMAH